MIKTINTRNFEKFGWVIHHPEKANGDRDKNLFCIVCSENSSVGWRIAYLVLRDKAIDKLEQHPDSLESFEPVYGRSILYVTDIQDHEKIECFYLDRPVVLRKGIWHGVVALTDEAEIKITENYNVEMHFWPVGKVLGNKGKPIFKEDGERSAVRTGV